MKCDALWSGRCASVFYLSFPGRKNIDIFFYVHENICVRVLCVYIYINKHIYIYITKHNTSLYYDGLS